MWPFSKSKKILKTQERQAIVSELDAAQTVRDTTRIFSAIGRFYDGGHAQGREGSEVVAKAIFTVDQYSISDALRLATWCINNKATEQAQRRYLSLLTIPLTDIPGGDDAQTLAQICATNLTAASSRSGYDIESAASARWKASLQKLRAVDLQMAFAAACNAALSKDSHVMIEGGTNHWEQMVGDLHKTSPAEAVAEIKRVTENYKDFGIPGETFRARARRLQARLG